MAQTKVKSELIDGGLGTDWQSTIQTSNFTAEAGKGYFVNTTSSAVTVSLPAGSAGDEIHFTDYASTFDTNEIIFDANGSQKIQGRTTNAKNATEGATVRLIYQDDIKGWTGNILDIPSTFSINYLVIAGGAAGGGFYRAGGGGAGGLRTSYGSTSGGGSNSESIISNVSSGTSYTITVGAGGAGAASPANNGGSGSNSVFSTITSAGGGGGGRYTATTGTAGAAGGSGGGGGGDATGGAAGAAYPANQGYAGGIGASSNIQCGGGGGGAGAVGKNGGSGATDGDGGDGIQSAILNYANAGTANVGERISGSQVWYGGGGGGGSYASGNDTIPGKGGGGEGTNPSNYPTNGSPATVNTGGGGGGASGDAGIVGGAGGSGVVILRYPSAQTITVPSGITQSSGSPFTEGSDKISVFTAGTGTISIN